MTRKHTFPAGKYYVGDPCYAVADENWSKLIDETGCFGLDMSINIPLDVFDDGLFLYNGKNCFIGSTKYGDGSYRDINGLEYLVDSGSLGVMPFDACDGDSMRGGQVLEFDNEFDVWEHDGNLHFENNCIFTGDEDEDDWDKNDYDYEDEDE